MDAYRVNLLPPKLQREGIIDFHRLALVGGITLLLAVALGSYSTFLLNFSSLKNDLESTKQQLVSLTPLVTGVEGIINERKELEAILEEYNTILNKRITWSSDLLADLVETVPVDLWLVELNVYHKPVEQQAKSITAIPDDAAQGESSKPNVMTVKGFSRTVSSVGVFINKLCLLPYFYEVRLNNLNSESEGIKFELTAIIRDDI